MFSHQLWIKPDCVISVSFKAATNMWEALPEAQPFKIRDTSSVAVEFVGNAAIAGLTGLKREHMFSKHLNGADGATCKECHLLCRLCQAYMTLHMSYCLEWRWLIRILVTTGHLRVSTEGGNEILYCKPAYSQQASPQWCVFWELSLNGTQQGIQAMEGSTERLDRKTKGERFLSLVPGRMCNMCGPLDDLFL